MDIDKLFKAPAISTGLKRKGLPDQPSAEVLKRFRPSDSDTASDSSTNRRAATVEDETENEEEGHFEDVADDEDGRFFGGGLNDEQNQILDIFDKAGEGDQEGVSTLTVPALRRLLGRFDRAVIKNAEQRGKYPDDPTQFIDSESDLDALLKQFLPLTQNPALYYPELVNSGAVALLANLLSHENADIAVDVIEVLQELTDEDVGTEEGEDEQDDFDNEDPQSASKARLALAQFVDELLGQSIFELLVSNLKRLNEGEEADRQGVFQILGIFENLLNFMPPLAEHVGASTELLPWLVQRLEAPAFDSNKQYASEILSILLQQPSNARKVLKLNGVDVCLTALSRYRKVDPQDSEEQEYMESTFDCLSQLLILPESKPLFMEAEGVELMVIMMKQKLQARYRALKVLDYALQGDAGSANCERFVEVLGLKSLFPLFMGKGGDRKKVKATGTFQDDEHILGILASLFSNLASDSAPRIRLVAKFVELDYEKVDRLLEMRESAETRLIAEERHILDERQALAAEGEEVDDIQEEEWYLARLSAGLAAQQTADYVLSWVCMEDDGAFAHAKQLLARKGKTFADVQAVLKERLSHIPVNEDEQDVDQEMVQQKVVLTALVDFISA